MLRLAWLCGLFASIVACGAGESRGDADTTGETSDDADTEGDGDGDGDGEQATPARGIDIVRVDAQQGTAVVVAQGDQWIGPAERNSVLVSGRDTYLRVFYELDASWVPREIEARLHLETGGEETIVASKRMISGPSEEKYLDTTFNFAPPGELVQNDTRFLVELVEVEPAGGEGLPEGVTVSPADGLALLGIQSEPLEMKIVIVPVDYTFMNRTTEISDQDVQDIVDHMYQQNPVQVIFPELHDPIERSTALSGLGSLLFMMADLRMQEGAADNVYYHALIDIGGPAINMVAGISQLPSDKKGDGINRVSATVWHPPGKNGSLDTFVHEAGHAQGRPHVYCPQASQPAANPDPSYPHEGGKIGVWGYGLLNGLVYPSTVSHDYMTYCQNAWVSDFGWTKAWQRISTLTAWDYEDGGATPPEQDLLVGALYEDGTQEWMTMRGTFFPERASSLHHVEFLTDGEVTSRTLAELAWLSDDRTRWVIAPLPADFQRVDQVVHTENGRPDALHVAEIRLAHER